MKNPAWDDSRPHSEEEVKVEIHRLLGEVEGMVERMNQSQARIERSRQATKRTLQRIEERFDVARSA